MSGRVKAGQDEYIDDLWFLAYGDHADKNDLGHQMGVRNVRQLIEQKGMKLLKITPVYGAFVLVLGVEHALVANSAT